jgi:hypothetical protein
MTLQNTNIRKILATSTNNAEIDQRTERFENANKCAIRNSRLRIADCEEHVGIIDKEDARNNTITRVDRTRFLRTDEHSFLLLHADPSLKQISVSVGNGDNEERRVARVG